MIKTAQLSSNDACLDSVVIVVATPQGERTDFPVSVELVLIFAATGICHYCVERDQEITTEVIL